MTENQWLACEEPRRMLGFLRTTGRASERKRRLLVCAVARALWPALADERSRTAVEVAERLADGVESLDALRQAATQARQAHDELCEAFIAARRATGGKYRKHVKEAAARADASAVAAWAAADDPLGFWNFTTHCGGDELGFYDSIAAVDSLLQEHHAFIFELFGNPFSPACVEPAWLAWGDGVAGKMARAIHDARNFKDMPILADALEEAGCGDACLLGHLRDPGSHALGCWALDTVLGLL